MKLILKDGDIEVELKELNTINKDSDVVIFFLKKHLEPWRIGQMAESLEVKLNKEVVILPCQFLDKAYSL